MTTLSGQKIKSTYKDLLQISNSNSGIDATIRYVEDGEGTASVLGLSTTGVTVNGVMKIGTYTIAPSGDLTTGGALTFAGAYPCTITLTGATTLTFPTSGSFVTDDSVTTLTNKTITSPILSGSVTGTYTLAGTPTITSPTINNPTLTTPALGTPSSGILTNCTGLPVSTGITGFGANVATFLATPSSANLRSALTDKTGSGVAVFGTSPSLTTPSIGTSINDSNGNEVIKIVASGSAVNELTITNGPTGNDVTLSATGDDANVGITFQAKGDSYYQFKATASTAARLVLYEDTDNGTDSIIFRPVGALAATRTIQLPDADGYVALDSTSTAAWTSFVPGFTGFSANPTSVVAAYKQIGNTIFIRITMTAGTSNATTFTITNLPVTTTTGQWLPIANGTNNSSVLTTSVYGTISGTTLTLFAGGSSSGWTSSGTKGINGNFFYELT